MEYKELTNFISNNSGVIKIEELALKPELCKDIQLILVELGLLNTADGIYGIETKRAFAEFKKINYQFDVTYLGYHSAKLLLSSANQEQDEVIDKSYNFVPTHREAKPVPNKINWHDFNCSISRYFFVKDVIGNDSRRIPNNITVEKRVLAMALELDSIQENLDTGYIVVKSWLRPENINKEVGGSQTSPHTSGGAVDIYCEGKDTRSFQRFVDKRWYGGLGFGAGQNTVHIDRRNGKGWWSSENLIQGDKGTRWTHSV
jgi:hypothetical protein